MVAGYASVAAQTDVHKIHEQQGIKLGQGASIENCPHASAARAAARMADDLAKAANMAKKAPEPVVPDTKAAAAGCPFHQQKQAAATAATAKPAKVKPAATEAKPARFDYAGFYDKELEKKHQDKSYRYFTNINRLAAKFPVAHTAEVEREVEVWCANDYLGMGNNPVVLETMQ